jgi:hypothetical protein
MNAEEFKAKLVKGEEIDVETKVTKEVVEKFGIDSEDSEAVVLSLQSKKIRTWGNLLAVEEKKEVVEYAGDKISGTTIWNALVEYKRKRQSLTESGKSTTKRFQLSC